MFVFLCLSIGFCNEKNDVHVHAQFQFHYSKKKKKPKENVERKSDGDQTKPTVSQTIYSYTPSRIHYYEDACAHFPLWNASAAAPTAIAYTIHIYVRCTMYVGLTCASPNFLFVIVATLDVRKIPLGVPCACDQIIFPPHKRCPANTNQINK